jgi:hypothetical protein
VRCCRAQPSSIASNTAVVGSRCTTPLAAVRTSAMGPAAFRPLLVRSNMRRSQGSLSDPGSAEVRDVTRLAGGCVTRPRPGSTTRTTVRSRRAVLGLARLCRPAGAAGNERVQQAGRDSAAARVPPRPAGAPRSLGSDSEAFGRRRLPGGCAVVSERTSRWRLG